MALVDANGYRVSRDELTASHCAVPGGAPAGESATDTDTTERAPPGPRVSATSRPRRHLVLRHPSSVTTTPTGRSWGSVSRASTSDASRQSPAVAPQNPAR